MGKSIIKYFENLLTKTPIIRNIYSSVKQILHAVSLPGKQAFKRVVLVDFPREGVKSVGFVTGSTKHNNGKEFINVFVPTIPNPTTGFLIFVSEDSITDTNLTVEEAFKLLFSGGVLAPLDFVTNPGRYTSCLNLLGVHVGWCRRRTSNPVCPAYSGIGGFDSHTLPPYFIFLLFSRHDTKVQRNYRSYNLNEILMTEK